MSQDRPLTIGIDGRELQGRPTGTGRYLRNLLRRWAGGPDRLVVYVHGAVPDDRVLASPNVTVRSLGTGRERGLLWMERRLTPAARRDGLDVFFAPAYVCPLGLDLPRVTAVHDLSFYAYPEDFGILDGIRRRLLVGASMRASRTVLACSSFTRREIVRVFPEVASRVVAVALGPDDDLPPPPSREAERARLVLHGPLLLTVGAILNRRRLPVLLHAAAVLARSWPGLALEIVGENRTHPLLDIPRLVHEMGLEHAVRVAGYLSDDLLVARYAAADVCVFLSEYEGFGLPALEAMSRGVPVVTSLRPSLGEIFGEAALLVDPSDDGAVAAAVDSVLRDPALRADLVARGRGLAARHSWDTTAALTRAELARAAGPR